MQRTYRVLGLVAAVAIVLSVALIPSTAQAVGPRAASSQAFQLSI